MQHIAQDPITREELRELLAPGSWSITGEHILLPLPTRDAIAQLERQLVNRVIRAGLREALTGEHVDEGELGRVAWIEPGELLLPELAGLFAIHVHVHSGSTRAWIYKPDTVLERPHAVEALERAS